MASGMACALYLASNEYSILTDLSSHGLQHGLCPLFGQLLGRGEEFALCLHTGPRPHHRMIKYLFFIDPVKMNCIFNTIRYQIRVFNPVLWIRIQIGSVFRSFVDPNPFSDHAHK